MTTNSDLKRFVCDSYDRIAEAYHTARCKHPPAYLRSLAKRLPAESLVLDIGCGSGVPIAKSLASQFHVTGVDISQRQIELARKAVPSATFFHGDITTVMFEYNQFDAAIMLYSLFHIPRSEHASLFRKIHTWLGNNGYLLLSLSLDSAPGYTEDDFFGTSMYWSHFSQAESLTILEDVGFEVVWQSAANHGYQNDIQPQETHPIALLRAR